MINQRTRIEPKEKEDKPVPDNLAEVLLPHTWPQLQHPYKWFRLKFKSLRVLADESKKQRMFLFSFTWHTPIRPDMERHGSPSGQFQSTWRLLVLNEYQFCLLSGGVQSIIESLQYTYCHLCSNTYHTSMILMFALEIQVELTLPFSRSKGMVSLAIVQCALPPPDLSFQAFPSSTIFYLTLLTSN